MESQLRAFHRFHERLEIAKAAVSTFPPPRPRLPLSNQKRSQKAKTYMGTVEKWKSKTRISTFPPSRSACGARKKPQLLAPCRCVVSWSTSAAFEPQSGRANQEWPTSRALD